MATWVWIVMLVVSAALLATITYFFVAHRTQKSRRSAPSASLTPSEQPESPTDIAPTALRALYVDDLNRENKTRGKLRGQKATRTSDDLLKAAISTSELLRKYEIPHAVMFGTLLGMVRDGKPIPNDDDVDICVHSEHFDAVEAMITKEKLTRHAAYYHKGVFMQLNHDVAVDLYFFQHQVPADESHRVPTDSPPKEQSVVFKWNFYGHPNNPRLWMNVPAELLLPFQNMRVSDTSDYLAVPNKPKDMVTYLYGQRWNERFKRGQYKVSLKRNVPCIEYVTDASATDNDAYWRTFYATDTARELSKLPSPFARFVVQWMKSHFGEREWQDSVWVDIGCGNGRDSLFFASQTHPVASVNAWDRCEKGIEHCSRLASAAGYRHLKAQVVDIGQRCRVDTTDESPSTKFSVIYCRWIIHALSPAVAAAFMRWAYQSLAPNGFLCIEARTRQDPLYQQGQPGPHPHSWIHTHYRRFIDPEELSEELRTVGFGLVHFEASDQFSPPRHESERAPHLLRCIAQKP